MKIKVNPDDDDDDNNSMLDHADEFEELLQSLDYQPGEPANLQTLQDISPDDLLLLRAPVQQPLPSQIFYQQPATWQPQQSSVFQFQGSGATAGAQALQWPPATTRPVYRTVRMPPPPPQMPTSVENHQSTERQVIRDRLMKRRVVTEGAAGGTPSLDGPSTSGAINDNKASKPASKNAEQARRNRLRKKEEERIDNLRIDELEQRCMEHEKSNNSLRSQIMGHVAEKNRLLRTIAEDPQLGRLVSLRPQLPSSGDVAVIEEGTAEPVSGGVCLSIDDATGRPAELCERCSSRFCAGHPPGNSGVGGGSQASGNRSSAPPYLCDMSSLLQESEGAHGEGNSMMSL